ncbi:MAG: hypothetical protein LUC22_07315 [Prevotella sp.]|nr:hypothetical protein [Prevotella sp.]
MKWLGRLALLMFAVAAAFLAIMVIRTTGWQATFFLALYTIELMLIALVIEEDGL